MRVVHVITGLGTGGAEMMLYKLLANVDSDKVTSSVITLRGGGPLQSRIESLGIPVLSVGAEKGPQAFSRLPQMLRQFQPDVIQGWMSHGNLVATVAGLAGPRRAPVIWNVRHGAVSNQDISRATMMLIRGLAWLSRAPFRIIYNSQSGADFHHGLGYHPERSTVIPNCFETDRFTPSPESYQDVRNELGLAPDTKLIGLIGRFHPVKDHGTFVTAAAKLAPSYPKLHFLLVGTHIDECNDDLMRLVRAGGLTDRVHLLGERQDIPRLTAALDIAALTSTSEGFPNVLGEAMSSQVPCVATDVGDCAALIDDTGLIVPPQDPEAMAAAMASMLAMSEAERAQLGRRARERILTQFTIAKITNTYQTLYEEAFSPRA